MEDIENSHTSSIGSHRSQFVRSSYAVRDDARTLDVDSASRALGLKENTFYGHDWALADWVGREAPAICNGKIQHGWNPGYPGFCRPVRSRIWPDLQPLVWSARLASESQQRFGSGISIGSPFAYLATQVFDGQDERQIGHEAEQTIYYPEHTWEGSSGVRSWGEVAERVLSFCGATITVCLYYHDFRDPEARRAFENRFLRVISHGESKTDPNHLRNQIDSILQSRTVITEGITTASLYGLALGRDVLQIPPNAAHAPTSTSLSYDYVMHELGFDQLWKPDELARILGWEGPTQTRLKLQSRYRATKAALPTPRIRH